MNKNLPSNFSNIESDDLLEILKTNASAGLSDEEAAARQKKYGKNIIQTSKLKIFGLLLRQITDNPLLIILAGATIVSFLLGDRTSSFYVLGIIVVSILLGFWNEYSAERTVESLLKKISSTVIAVRNGIKQDIAVSQITIGDIVFLNQGVIIPADLRLLEASKLEVNESSLSGESKSVHKTLINSGKSENLVFMGTSVESGTGKGVVVKIGRNTEFGKIAGSVAFVKPTTEFQKGLTKLGSLIIKFVIVLTVIIFLVNAFLKNDILTSLMFALAVAVGITPELLPVIVTVSLSNGAGKLAKKHVVVKKLLSLESLGNIDVLCTDKTGTLTEGRIEVKDYVNIKNDRDLNVLIASLFCNNAIVHKNITGNAIDTALWEHAIKEKLVLNKDFKKLFEEEFDYNRKLNYSVIKSGNEISLFAKGSPESILPLCKHLEHRDKIIQELNNLRENGLRLVVVAKKSINDKSSYDWSDADHLEYLGYISFLDTPKKSAAQAISQLKNLNVTVKIITGDNEIVTKKICEEVGIDVKRVLTGPQIDNLSDAELRHIVDTIDIFARVLPLQKLKIIKTLQLNNHSVGYLGDGINDLPALHHADVGICVNSAVDVAKSAASVVLLRKGLDVIDQGIREGRRTFSNTLKYILITASSNFGNMFSVTGASFLLPFLPMTAVQILLTNALYDMAQIFIPNDNVDQQALLKPRHWKVEYIKRYMLFFGPLSSVFDFLTFGVLFFVFQAGSKMFQTGWFVESLITQVLIVFVIRTIKKPFYLSKPGLMLLIASIIIIVVAVILPFTTIGEHLGFTPLPALYFVYLAVIAALYLFVVDNMKGIFLKKWLA